MVEPPPPNLAFTTPHQQPDVIACLTQPRVYIAWHSHTTLAGAAAPRRLEGYE